jgi:hypothetical protein
MVEPAATFWVRNGIIVAALKSAHAHADSTGSPATLFDSRQYERRFAVLELSAPSQTGLFPANPRVINLYLTAQRFPRRIHHRPAKFVKHRP